MARPQPSLRFADGGSFITRWAEGVMRPNATAKRLREIEAPPPPPAQPPAPPPPPPNPRVTKDNPAGIRFQDGGHVPGTGRGDKIPAKYEPGEFVVSNDMIDDNPGLREGLSSLRAETLAARGKTVEEADAGATRHMGSLRAADGWDPLDRMAKSLTGQNSLPPRSPMGNMAEDLVRNARPAPAPFDGSRNFSVPGTEVPRGPSSSIVPGPPAPIRAPLDTSLTGPSSKYPRTFDVPHFSTPSGYPSSSLAGGPAAAAAEAAHGQRVNPTLRPNQVAFHGDGRYGAPANGPSNASVAALNEANAATRAASGLPGAPSTANTASKWFGSADDWKGMANGAKQWAKPEMPAAPGKIGKALGVLQGAAGAYDAYQGIQEGDALKAGVGAADTVAAGALFTPAAPAAAAYLGVRGAWDTSRAVGDYINTKLSDDTKDAIGRGVNWAAQATGLGGVDDSAYRQIKAANPEAPATKPANTKTLRTDANNPYADANARKIAQSDAQNAAADAQAQVQQTRDAGGGAPYTNARPDLGYGNFDPRTLTNEQAGVMNPRGKVTMTRGANGNMEFSGNDVSGQVSYNDASGKAYAGGGLPLPGGGSQGFANFDVVPAGANVVMGPNGYASATSGSGLRGQGGQGGGQGYTQDGIDTRGLNPQQASQYAAEVRQARAINASQAGQSQSYDNRLRQWNDITSEVYKARRSLQMDSGKLSGRKANSAALSELAKTHFGVAGGDRDDATRRYQSDQILEGTRGSNETERYKSDNSLRGDQVRALGDRRTAGLSAAQKQQETLMYGEAFRAAGGDPVRAAEIAAGAGLDPARFTGMAAAGQARGAANDKSTRGVFSGLFGKDGEQKEAQAHHLAQQMFPDWNRMSPEDQAKASTEVVQATKLLSSMNNQRNTGWGKKLGFDSPSLEMSQMPDMDGATVGSAKLLEGLTPGVDRGDHKITLRDGTPHYIRAGELSEQQMSLLEKRGAKPAKD